MKTWQQKIKYATWWYGQWRNANGISGNAASDWQWAYDALTSFPLVSWAGAVHFKTNQRITDPNGHCQIVTSGGARGVQMPVWNQDGGVTVDGAVAWLDMGVAAPW